MVGEYESALLYRIRRYYSSTYTDFASNILAHNGIRMFVCFLRSLWRRHFRLRCSFCSYDAIILDGWMSPTAAEYFGETKLCCV